MQKAKVLTANKLALRHWPCNPICPLLIRMQKQLSIFASISLLQKEVWTLVKNWVGDHITDIDRDVQCRL